MKRTIDAVAADLATKYHEGRTGMYHLPPVEVFDLGYREHRDHRFLWFVRDVLWNEHHLYPSSPT